LVVAQRDWRFRSAIPNALAPIASTRLETTRMVRPSIDPIRSIHCFKRNGTEECREPRKEQSIASPSTDGTNTVLRWIQYNTIQYNHVASNTTDFIQWCGANGTHTLFRFVSDSVCVCVCVCARRFCRSVSFVDTTNAPQFQTHSRSGLLVSPMLLRP